MGCSRARKTIYGPAEAVKAPLSHKITELYETGKSHYPFFRSLLRLTELAITYAAAGQSARARTLLREAIADREGYVPPYWIAVAYLFLGEKDNAVQWLQRACRKNDPTLDEGRSNARLNPL